MLVIIIIDRKVAQISCYIINIATLHSRNKYYYVSDGKKLKLASILTLSYAVVNSNEDSIDKWEGCAAMRIKGENRTRDEGSRAAQTLRRSSRRQRRKTPHRDVQKNARVHKRDVHPSILIMRRFLFSD